MPFTQPEREKILERVFPSFCETVGPKNLKKICQDQRPELVKMEHGSNMMFGDMLTTLFQAVEFIDAAFNVYKHLKNEPATPEKVINITINNININPNKLSQKNQLKLAELVMQYIEEDAE